jgi:hypothetical protein
MLLEAICGTEFTALSRPVPNWDVIFLRSPGAPRFELFQNMRDYPLWDDNVASAGH